MASPSQLRRRRPASDVERLKALLAPEFGVFCIELDAQGRFRQFLCQDVLPDWPDPLPGQGLLDYLPEPARSRLAADLESAVTGGEPVTIEFKVESQGHERWFSSIVTPLVDETDQPDGCLIVGRDITVQRAALAQAEFTSQLFRRVVDHSPGVITLVHPAEGIAYLNEGVAGVLGYAADALLGWQARSIVTEADAERLEALVRADRAAGRRMTATIVRARHRDGRWRQLALNLEYIDFPDGIMRLLVAARDITAEVQAEEGLRQERDLAIALSELGALMNSSLDLGEVLNRILSAAAAVVPSELSSIMLIQGDRAEIVAHRGMQERGIRFLGEQNWMAVTGDTHVARAVRDQLPEIVSDTEQDPAWALFYGPSPIRSSLITPIVVKGAVIGLLNVDSLRPGAFVAEDARRLQAFSDQAGVALANARLFEQISAEKDRIGLLYRWQHDLDVTLGPRALMQRAIAFADFELLATSAELWWAIGTPLPAVGRLERHVAPGCLGTAMVDAPWLTGLSDPLILTARPGAGSHDGGRQDPRWHDLADAADRDSAIICLPLRVGGRLLGALVLRAADPGFLFADRGLLQALAQVLALALESAHLIEADRDRADDLAILDRLSTALIDPLSVEDLATRIGAVIRAELGVLTCDLELATKTSNDAAVLPTERADDIAAVAARLDCPILIDDLQAEPERGETAWVPRARQAMARAQAAFPLRASGRAVGVLVVEHGTPGGFSARDRRVLAAFAERAASAVHSTLLVEALADDARYLSTLNEISRSGLRGTDLTSLLERTADLVVDLIQADSASISLWDDIRQQYLPSAGSASIRDSFIAEIDRATERRFSDFIIEARQPMVVPDISSPSAFVAAPSRRLPGKTLLGAPLLLGERVIGALIVAYHQLHPVTSVDLERVRHASGIVALSIANQQLFDELASARQTAETANQLKGEFLANTSHELRTPLTGILGALRLVLDDVCEDREEERAFVNTAHDAALRLLTHINELLDLSKIEAGQMQVDLEPVDVSLIMHQVFELLAPRASQQGVELNIEDRLPVDARAVADPEHVRHILLNLVGNALKFTAHGEVRLRATADAGWAHLSVTDTGIGIPVDSQAALFQPFVQVDGSSTRRFGGTGLGLAISRRLAEGMGGTLDLYSAGRDQGSTFTVRLPLWHADAA